MPARAETHELFGIRDIGRFLVVRVCESVDVDQNVRRGSLSGERVHARDTTTWGKARGRPSWRGVVRSDDSLIRLPALAGRDLGGLYRNLAGLKRGSFAQVNHELAVLQFGADAVAVDALVNPEG